MKLLLVSLLLSSFSLTAHAGSIACLTRNGERDPNAYEVDIREEPSLQLTIMSGREYLVEDAPVEVHRIPAGGGGVLIRFSNDQFILDVGRRVENYPGSARYGILYFRASKGRFEPLYCNDHGSESLKD